MSMRDYAVDDYGLVLDKDTVNDIASQIFEDYTENSDDYWDMNFMTKAFANM